MAVSAQDEGDDGSLVLAVQRGDGDAFAELFRRHYPAVRRACARRLFDPVDADEAAQAAFVRAYERIEQCAGERRFGSWVHVIARSLCQDAFRAQARVEPVAQPLAGGRDHRPNEPEESLLRSERAAQVHEALAMLPDRQRRAVIARDWDELRPGEIADSLGLSVGAVDSLLLRARRRLALSYRRLAGEGGGGASTHAVRSGAAGVAAVLALGSQTIASATVVAAQTVHDAAGGVVGAMVTVAMSLGGASAPVAPPPDPPAAVTTVVTAPGTPAAPRRSRAAAAVDPPPVGPAALLPAEQQVVAPPVPVTTSPPAPSTTLPERPRTAREAPATTTPTSPPANSAPAAAADDGPAAAPPVTEQVGLPPRPTVPAIPLPSLPLAAGESPHGRVAVGG